MNDKCFENYSQKQDLLNYYYNAYLLDRFDERNFFDYPKYYELLGNVFDDISKFRYYEFTGITEDSFIEVLNNNKIKENKSIEYYNFICGIVESIKRKSDDYVLIVSLNGLRIEDSKIGISYSKPDFILFNNNWKERKLLRDDIELARYLKSELDVDLNANHMRFKDRNFFYNPVMTINYRDTSRGSLYQKAPNIALAIYTFIRLIDFINYSNWDRWNEYKVIKPAQTYAVYFSSIDSGLPFAKRGTHGHQMKYVNTPILDVESSIILSRMDELYSLYETYQEVLFTPQIEVSKNQYLAYQRYIKSIELINTAYEMASVEKFDETLILLTTFLESLFLKNSGRSKKSRLCNLVSEYLGDDYKELIDESYKRRNSFVHEGKSLPKIYNYKLAEVEHNYYMGHRPFNIYSMAGYPTEINELKNLFVLCINIVLSMTKNKQFLVGEYIKA